MIELHCHTTCSDGTLTPTALVTAARTAGVRALAITDHDTIAGWDEAMVAARPLGLEIVPGLELSTVHRGRSLHILGFYPDPVRLGAPLQERTEGRKRRAREMVARLTDLGYPVTLPEVGSGVALSRPHIARALVAAGHVQSNHEAFERLIGDDGPAYVHYEKFSIEEGLQLLRHCGAVSVWAHPYLFRGGEVEAVLPELLAAGLMGLEVYHPHHTSTQTRKLEQLCEAHGLLMSGGSDYHGPSQSTSASTLNMLNVPLALLAPIARAAADLKAFYHSTA